MGCCVSTKKFSNEIPFSPPKEDRSLVPESDTLDIKPTASTKYPAPPPLPPLLEEETVKEVLSETPTPKPPSFLKPEQTTPSPPLFPRGQEEPRFPKLLPLPLFPEIEGDKKKKKKTPSLEEVSETLSETSVCSTSAFSLSTSALTERRLSRDDFERFDRFERSPCKIPPRKRSVSGDFTFRGINSPARKREPNTIDCRKGVVVRNRSTRNSGESSGRRFGYPVTRTDISSINRNGVFRSPSSKRFVGSPGRNPALERIWKEDENKWQTKESLEDPLVSLECFIFL